MTTVIEIYPKKRKPRWLEVGAVCEVNGEGTGDLHEVVEVDVSGCRAAVRRFQNQGGMEWWESYGKLYQSYKSRKQNKLRKQNLK